MMGMVAGVDVAAQQTADPAGQIEVRSLRQGAIGHYEAALNGLDRLPIDQANLACLLWVDDRVGVIPEIQLRWKKAPKNESQWIVRIYLIE